MKFEKGKIQDSWVIKPTLLQDSRGFFCETWNQREFAKYGIHNEFKQGNLSRNILKNTLRGLHYQTAPFQEDKLIRVPNGSVFDVIVDLRPDSVTYRQWQGLVLDDKEFLMLYIPKGCAHGYQTLEDNTIVSYEVSQFYQPSHARGIKWDDPTLKISWPHCENRVISEKDLSNPAFVE